MSPSGFIGRLLDVGVAAPGLPLRKGSVINEALQNAHHKLRYNLHEAVKAYFDSIQNTASDLRRKEAPPIDDLPQYRDALMQIVAGYDNAQRVWREKLQAAIEKFDSDAADLNAWLTAARAADKVRP